uniref:FBA_2 domain-containing protein n=1 Tax=Steinernema glaseri TaxID=37863 RepID=A0A1I7Y6P4_9BILA
MDSLSFYFVAEVVARLESMEDVQKLGGVWSAAAEEEADSRILCTLRLTVRKTYSFDCEPGGPLTFKEVEKLNLKHLRVTRIVILFNVRRGGMVLHEYSESESASEMLSFAYRYFTCGHHLSAVFDPVDMWRDWQLLIVQGICDLNNIREVFFMHGWLADPESIFQLLKNANPEVLKLHNAWSDSNLRLMLSWWADRNIKEFHIHTMQTDLNMDLLKHIYQLWEDGFFATRSFYADLKAKVSDRKLTPMLGQPTGEGLDKEWRVEHPSRKTFQLSRFRVGDVRMRLTIA